MRWPNLLWEWLWRRPILGLAVLFWAASTGSAARADSTRVDFNFDVRPILSDRCFKCHGPDEKSRKAQLRFDQRGGFYAKLSDGRVPVAPGHPELSEMIRRVCSKDPKVRMPPPESGLSLSDDEAEVLRRWVEQGAEYKRHWAFIPADKVAEPDLRDPWVRNPIDAFVLAQLRRHHLQPSPPADAETLLRRLSLDLRGLPPSLDELNAFLSDRSPDAFSKWADKFLNSPRYGERMAEDWMDLARFADTYGYQQDATRDMSPWRDWVIRAFNENLPYNQFIVWQLAGDLLPGATRDQVLATAFNRLHRQTNEGGSIEEEFRVEYAADRVQTFGTAFLGLTVQCARCHDHKFDPITQKNYYQLFAYFDNIDESGLYSYFTQATPSPSLLLYKPGQEEAHAGLERNIQMAEAALRRRRESSRQAFAAWKRGPREIALPEPAAFFPFDVVESNLTPDLVEGSAPARLHDDPQLAEGHSGKAMLFSGDNSVTCPGVGQFRRTDPFTFDLWLRVGEKQDRAVVFHYSRAWTDSGSRGYELLLERGRPSFGLIHFYPGNAIRVRARDRLPVGVWTRLTIAYDGSSRAAGVRIFRDGRLLPLEVVRDNLYKDIVHRSQWGDMDAGNIQLTLGARFRDSGFKRGAIDDFAVYDRCLTTAEIERLTGAAAPPTEAEWFDYYLARGDSEYQRDWSDLEQCRDAENDFINDIPEIMVMHEMKTRRPTFVLKRGAYNAPGERVEPDTPAAIMPMPPEYPRNRLGLAEWVINPRNPLTARVAVNRAWALHFGRGLVATLGDFGSQGALPTHPELLDWLAGWFMSHGWDEKALHRLIVNSGTYRQSSDAGEGQLAADPENRWLSRGPSYRLSAEEIRDSALAASGLMAPEIGGPSVKPYQPAGLWEESGTGKHYDQGKGEQLYRRSLYTFWRRTSPPPSMMAFDAPTREVCLARRELTVTPMQALVLLDDRQFVEAARVLSQKLVRDCRDDSDTRLARAFRILIGRHAAPGELAILKRMYAKQEAYFEKKPKAARAFESVGEYPIDPKLPAAEVAATEAVANALMNYDDFIIQR